MDGDIHVLTHRINLLGHFPHGQRIEAAEHRRVDTVVLVHHVLQLRRKGISYIIRVDGTVCPDKTDVEHAVGRLGEGIELFLRKTETQHQARKGVAGAHFGAFQAQRISEEAERIYGIFLGAVLASSAFLPAGEGECKHQNRQRNKC